MDITGLQTLEEVILNLEARGLSIILCEANEQVRGKLDKAGILVTIESAKDYFDDFATAIARCDALVGSNLQMTHQQQVVLNKYAESLLKTSESYLRGTPNSRGEG